MSFLPDKGYEFGGSPDIAREDSLLVEIGIPVTSPTGDVAPHLDDADPIDVEALETRTVRGFSLTEDMTELL